MAKNLLPRRILLACLLAVVAIFSTPRDAIAWGKLKKNADEFGSTSLLLQKPKKKARFAALGRWLNVKKKAIARGLCFRGRRKKSSAMLTFKGFDTPLKLEVDLTSFDDKNEIIDYAEARKVFGDIEYRSAVIYSDAAGLELQNDESGSVVVRAEINKEYENQNFRYVDIVDDGPEDEKFQPFKGKLDERTDIDLRFDQDYDEDESRHNLCRFESGQIKVNVKCSLDGIDCNGKNGFVVLGGEPGSFYWMKVDDAKQASKLRFCWEDGIGIAIDNSGKFLHAILKDSTPNNVRLVYNGAWPETSRLGTQLLLQPDGSTNLMELIVRCKTEEDVRNWFQQFTNMRDGSPLKFIFGPKFGILKLEFEKGDERVSQIVFAIADKRATPHRRLLWNVELGETGDGSLHVDVAPYILKHKALVAEKQKGVRECEVGKFYQDIFLGVQVSRSFGATARKDRGAKGSIFSMHSVSLKQGTHELIGKSLKSPNGALLHFSGTPLSIQQPDTNDHNFLSVKLESQESQEPSKVTTVSVSYLGPLLTFLPGGENYNKPDYQK